MIDATGLMLEKVFLWLKYKLTGDDPRHWRVESHDVGFRCLARKKCDDVQWSDVCSIRAFKRAVLSNELVCVLFETKSGASVEIDEKMTGFGAIIKRLGKEFPSIPADWYDTMKFPTIKVNERILWQAEGG